MTALKTVLSIKLTDDWDEQRRRLEQVSTDAPLGSLLRLRVGSTTPYPWAGTFLRSDLVVQVESSNVTAAAEWHDALERARGGLGSEVDASGAPVAVAWPEGGQRD